MRYTVRVKYKYRDRKNRWRHGYVTKTGKSFKEAEKMLLSDASLDSNTYEGKGGKEFKIKNAHKILTEISYDKLTASA